MGLEEEFQKRNDQGSTHQDVVIQEMLLKRHES